MICPESHSSSMCAYLAVSDSFATLWTVARQVPLSMGFLRQESWSWWLFSFPRGLPDPGIKPVSLMSPALAGEFFTRSYPVATMEFEAKSLIQLLSFSRRLQGQDWSEAVMLIGP